MNARFALLTLVAALLALAAWTTLSPREGGTPAPVAREPDATEPPIDVDLGEDDLGAGALVKAVGRTVGPSDSIPEAAVPGTGKSPDVPAMASPALEIPSGTVVIGRLIDGDGARVGHGKLEVSQPDAKDVAYLTMDPDGRFAAAVDLHGEVTLFASAVGVGRSRDLTVFLPEGQATDVGDLRLLGSEVIRGYVRFPGGEPLPGIFVHAKAVDPLATPGLRNGSVQSGTDGFFEITALAPGLFDLEVMRDERLPILGESSIRAGEDNALLVVDAALLTVSCVNEVGETVPMKSLGLSNVINEEPGEDEAIGSTSYGWSKGVDSFELFVQPRRTYMIQAHDAEMKFYFAYLEGNLTAGVHEVLLRLNPPNLSSLKVSVPPGSLDGEARLSLGRIRRNGQDVLGTQLVGEGEPGAAFLEMRGLVPGSYELNVAVVNSEWVALQDPRRSFELAAGTTEEFLLETYEGGRVELVVVHEGAIADTKTRAMVQLRRAGDLEWSHAQLLSKRGSGSTFGGKAWIDGTLARSVVLVPGAYQLRVEAQGYLASEVDLMIQPRATTPLRITLLEE